MAWTTLPLFATTRTYHSTDGGWHGGTKLGGNKKDLLRSGAPVRQGALNMKHSMQRQRADARSAMSTTGKYPSTKRLKATPHFLPVVRVVMTMPGEVLTTALPLLQYVLTESVYYTQLVRVRFKSLRTPRTRGTTAVAKGTPLTNVEVTLES